DGIRDLTVTGVQTCALPILRPERVDARSNLGVVYTRLGRYAEAIEQYKRALSLDRTNQPIRFNLAVAYYKTARLVSASEELKAEIGRASCRERVEGWGVEGR